MYALSLVYQGCASNSFIFALTCEDFKISLKKTNVIDTFKLNYVQAKTFKVNIKSWIRCDARMLKEGRDVNHRTCAGIILQSSYSIHNNDTYR